MRAIVIYESMYGNTHLVADAIARGLGAGGSTVQVLPVAEATVAALDQADLVVVGAPTHAHGLSRPATRRSAADAAGKDGSDVHLDGHAADTGVREWLEALDGLHLPAVTFDTRMPGPPMLTGSASRLIAKRLSRHGFRIVATPESFLVDRHNHLRSGEEERAAAWGGRLATLVSGGV
ncbi:MAG TPA: flavodoxin domain-containing protein [Acidimicrobiales bacterium]|nr:flavodoxin domain-containing protein [Acidimicrobiales bacterium]